MSGREVWGKEGTRGCFYDGLDFGIAMAFCTTWKMEGVLDVEMYKVVVHVEMEGICIKAISSYYTMQSMPSSCDNNAQL